MVAAKLLVLDQILSETPHTSLIDLEDERLGARFVYDSASFQSKIGGMIFCEFDASRTQKERVTAFVTQALTMQLS